MSSFTTPRVVKHVANWPGRGEAECLLRLQMHVRNVAAQADIDIQTALADLPHSAFDAACPWGTDLLQASVQPLLVVALVATEDGSITQHPTVEDSTNMVLGTFNAALSASCVDAYAALTTPVSCEPAHMVLPSAADTCVAAACAEVAAILECGLRPLRHLSAHLEALYGGLLRESPAEYAAAWGRRQLAAADTLAEVQRLRQVRCTVLTPTIFLGKRDVHIQAIATAASRED